MWDKSGPLNKMKLNELYEKSILILGFGAEGQATYEFLRKKWPSKPLSIAEERPPSQFSADIARGLQSDPELSLHLGPEYLYSLLSGKCEVIIKTPGIPASVEQIVNARESGCILTSHSQIFLSNCPREKVIGITGTKGKSTTSSLIYEILRRAGIPAELVGNIGRPALTRLADAAESSYFVYEFSSHQLAEVSSSPHIAVLLNIVPEHLDYYSSFDEYAAAKENITRFQDSGDFLVFNADYAIPSAIAGRSRAALRPFSLRSLQGEKISWLDSNGGECILRLDEIPLPGRFNVQNVLAALAVASLCGVRAGAMRDAVLDFRALPHRLEFVGVFNGVAFYDDSIATVPESTLAALEALGKDVQTVILGGHERNLDFGELGARLPANVRNVILFAPTGRRIWEAIKENSQNSTSGKLPEAFFVENMEEAVGIAYARTERGKICLLSPASPSFGTFKDFKERGESYKSCVRRLKTDG